MPEFEVIKRKDWNYRLVDYFLHHSHISILLFAFIIIAGVFYFNQLRVEGFPAIKIPIAIVSTVVPGAGPETVISSVTSPLENALKDTEGLKEISSTSQNNISIIVLSFDDKVDLNVAVQDARTKLSKVKLPEGIESPEVVLPEISGAPYIVALTSEEPLLELLKQARVFEESLTGIDGVKSFSRISNITQTIYIDIAPQFQSPDITNQITSANISFPLGQAVIDGAVTPIAGSKSLNSVDDLRAILISLPGNPQSPAQKVRLDTIANVYEGIDYGNQIHWLGYKNSEDFKTQRALLYEIRLDQDADILAVDPKILEGLELAKRESKVGTDYVIAYNQAEESQRQVDEIVEGAVGGKWDTDNKAAANFGYIFGGVWLLMIVIFVFLDWRSALISALSIPLSFLATFIVLGVFGIQLNTLVLFSFVLVLGLIVDPAIVVLESIKRYLELGYHGKEAVLRSIDVIGQGIFMSVLTSVIVFVPFGIISGTFGQIIKYIPLTVVPALIISYFVPMLFLTWLGARFLKPHHTQTEIKDENDTTSLWGVGRWFIYINRYILSRLWLQWVVIILAFVIPVGISAFLFSSGKIEQVQFAQPDDVEYISVSVPLEGTLTEAQLIAKSTELENVIRPYTQYFKSYSYISLDGSLGGNSLPLFIHLEPQKDRLVKSSELVTLIQADLQRQFGTKAIASELGAGPPTASYPISIKIYSNDVGKLKEASQKISEKLRSYSEVVSVSAENDNPTSELTVKPNLETLKTYGLSPALIYGQLAGILGERTILTLNENEVRLRLPEQSKPHTVRELEDIIIFGPEGQVRVGDVATVTKTEAPSAISRLAGERYSQVSARVSDTKDIIRIQREINQWAKDNANNLGLPQRAFEDRAGQDEFEKSFQELFAAIALSIIVTYIVFVLFFRSFIQPFIILFAVPLIFIGVFPALAIFNKGQFGFLETIGIIMVIGIVENVGIFLIDYANRKTAEGLDKKEAIALSSGVRFRPILLTKLTALAGLLPLAVFAPFWRGLAVVVIAGILSSGILSLFTTPVLYSWFTRKSKTAIKIETI